MPRRIRNSNSDDLFIRNSFSLGLWLLIPLVIFSILPAMPSRAIQLGFFEEGAYGEVESLGIWDGYESLGIKLRSPSCEGVHVSVYYQTDVEGQPAYQLATLAIKPSNPFFQEDGCFNEIVWWDYEADKISPNTLVTLQIVASTVSGKSLVLETMPFEVADSSRADQLEDEGDPKSIIEYDNFCHATIHVYGLEDCIRYRGDPVSVGAYKDPDCDLGTKLEWRWTVSGENSSITDEHAEAVLFRDPTDNSVTISVSMKHQKGYAQGQRTFWFSEPDFYEEYVLQNGDLASVVVPGYPLSAELGQSPPFSDGYIHYLNYPITIGERKILGCNSDPGDEVRCNSQSSSPEVLYAKEYTTDHEITEPGTYEFSSGLDAEEVQQYNQGVLDLGTVNSGATYQGAAHWAEATGTVHIVELDDWILPPYPLGTSEDELETISIPVGATYSPPSAIVLNHDLGVGTDFAAELIITDLSSSSYKRIYQMELAGHPQPSYVDACHAGGGAIMAAWDGILYGSGGTDINDQRHPATGQYSVSFTINFENYTFDGVNPEGVYGKTQFAGSNKSYGEKMLPGTPPAYPGEASVSIVSEGDSDEHIDPVWLHNQEFYLPEIDTIVPGDEDLSVVWSRFHRSQRRIRTDSNMGWQWDHSYNLRMIEYEYVFNLGGSIALNYPSVFVISDGKGNELYCYMTGGADGHYGYRIPYTDIHLDPSPDADWPELSFPDGFPPWGASVSKYTLEFPNGGKWGYVEESEEVSTNFLTGPGDPVQQNLTLTKRTYVVRTIESPKGSDLQLDWAYSPSTTHDDSWETLYRFAAASFANGAGITVDYYPRQIPMDPNEPWGGLIKSVTNKLTSEVINYDYYFADSSSKCQLKSVTREVELGPDLDPISIGIRYGYHSWNAVCGISSISEIIDGGLVSPTLLYNTYQPGEAGRIQKQIWQGEEVEVGLPIVNATPSDYNDTHITTELKDRRGFKKTYEYNVMGNCVRKTESCDSDDSYENAELPSCTTDYVTEFEWTGEGELKKVTYPEGNATQYVRSYDLAGNKIIEVIDLPVFGSSAEPIRKEYTLSDCCDHVTQIADEQGNVTDFEYHADGTLKHASYPDGSEHFYLKLEMGDREVHIWPPDADGHYRYDLFEYSTACGKRVLADVYIDSTDDDLDDLADAPSDSFDGLGQNLNWHLEYDSNGFVNHVEDPKGNLVQYTNSIRGDVLRKTIVRPDQSQRVTKYFYRRPGQIKRIEKEYLTVDDNGDLVEVWNLPSTHPAYEAEYNSSNPKIQTIEYEWEHDRVTTATLTVGSGEQVVDVFGYDRNGNLNAFHRTGVLNGVPSPEIQAHNNVTIKYDQRDMPYRIRRGVGSNIESLLEYTYTANGNLEYIIQNPGEANSRTTTYEYDDLDRLASITDPLGNLVSLTYEQDLATTSTWNSYRVEEVEYLGQLTSLVDVGIHPLARTHFEYDVMGRTTKVEEELFKYNAYKSGTSLVFDPATGKYEDGTLPNGDLLFSEIPYSDSLNSTQFAYSPNGALISTTNDAGKTWDYHYDSAHRYAGWEDPIGNTQAYLYDANSNVTTSTLVNIVPSSTAETLTTVYRYDDLDRLTRVTEDPSGSNERTWELYYDSFDHIVMGIDPLGQVTRHQYDLLGRKLSTARYMYDANGTKIGENTTALDWDIYSRLISQTDPNGNATEYVYDVLNRPIATEHADGSEYDLTSYTDFSEPWVITDPNGSTITNVYDDLGRLTGRTISVGTGVSNQTTSENYYYDGLGRLLRAEDNDSVVTRAFDSASNLLSETQIDSILSLSDTLAFDADSMGRRKGISYPGSLYITRMMDALGRGTKFLDDYQHSIAINSYIGTGYRLGSRSFDVTVGEWPMARAAFEYDSLGRSTSIHLLEGSPSQGTFARHQFEWDALDNRSLWEELDASSNSVVAKSFTYDSLSRLTGVDGITIDYDPAGNRESVASGTQWDKDYDRSSPTDDVVNQYTEITHSVFNQQTQTYDETTDRREHDATGNLTRRGTFQSGQFVTSDTLTFDYRNRLVTYEDRAGPVTTYRYDALGRRIAKTTDETTTRYVYDGWECIQEQSSAGTPQIEFVYSDGIDDLLAMHRLTGAHQGWYYYHQDDQGNVVTLLDSSGAVVERYGYDAFGEPTVLDSSHSPTTASYGNPYFFTGRRYDTESGLYYYRHRYYDPETGRFITRDPIGIWGDPLNLGNGYTYTGNNPWSYVDPWGLRGWAAACGARILASADGFVNSLESDLAIYTVGAAVYGGAHFAADTLSLGEESAEISVNHDRMTKTEIVSGVAGEVGRASDIAGAAGFALKAIAAPFEAVGIFRTAKNTARAVDEVSDANRIVRSADEVADAADSITDGGKALDDTIKAGNDLPPAGCFVAGTLVQQADGPVAIEELEVGDRVLTIGDGEDYETEVNGDWQVVTLYMPNPDGGWDTLEVELLRSPEWFAETAPEVGKEITLEFPELDIFGPAWVVSIEPCPEIEDSPGRVVLATVTRLSTHILSIELQGADEPLVLTSTHRLYSEDEDNWIPAEDLRVGGRLRTSTGSVSIVSVVPLDGLPRVYNIEVETEHSYLVSDLGVLSHNVNPCSAPTPPQEPKGGTYFLKDPETGEVVRTGRTNNLKSRKGDHARKPETEEFKFEVDRTTDEYAAQRGREQIIHDEHPEARFENGGLNKNQPISPRNPNRCDYLEAGRKLD
ncbi:hypothetical protein KQI84_19380 [bacterium]|nr:hypothetical protein [bacterium]